MSYVDTEVTGEAAIRGFLATAHPTGRALFADGELARAAKLRVTCSSFNDPGEDWSDLTLLDADGLVIVERRIPGY